MRTIQVADIIAVMEQVAPPALAEEWDNCGLQVGSGQWPVRKIWVALDPLLEVVQAAIRNEVDLVISHHPLLIRPLRAIDVETPSGKIIESALHSRLALYAAHTNLDCAHEGVNTALARAIGIGDIAPLVPSRGVALVPADQPVIGMGRIGRLGHNIKFGALAKQIKTKLGLETIKVVGDPELQVQEIAVCSGSGSSLLDAFLTSKAQVFVSGDLRYHDARKVQDAHRCIIDIGHFSSEHLVIDPLVDRLSAIAKLRGWQVIVESCPLEQDPFIYM